MSEFSRICFGAPKRAAWIIALPTLSVVVITLGKRRVRTGKRGARRA
jgi:hypothetical protein